VSPAEPLRDAPSPWKDLLEQAGSGRSSSAILDRLATEFLHSSNLGSFGLYRLEDEQYSRRFIAGAEPLPATFGVADVGAYATREIPGGIMLYEPGPAREGQLDEHLLLTLLCALEAAELGNQLKRHSFAANLRGVELQSLYDVGLAIAGTLDQDKLGDEVLLRAVSLLDARVGALYLRDGDEYRLDRTFGGDARERVASDDPGLVALLEGETSGEPLLPGTQYPLCVPIEADVKPLGLLVVADKESRTGVGPFAEADERMLGLFANQAAIALENANLHRQALEKERLERELDLAADIQRQLLPTVLPDVEGYEFAGWSRPARHVGGDYYDLQGSAEEGVHLVLGDVSGKGMPAALLVSTLHSALRLLLSARPFDAELVRSVNSHIADSSAANKFITMTAARLDPTSGSMRYVNAGHNPPLLVRRDGSIEELPPGGMPLGIVGNAPYADASIDLKAGDLLCIFSDGITECETPEGEEYGPERLGDLLRSVAEAPLTEIIEAIDRTCVDFAAGGPQGDDQTVVLVRRSA